MAHILKFGKGEFITQINSSNCFAIFEGIVYDSSNDDNSVDYSLYCYYNPNHYEIDDNGKRVSKQVFEYDLGEKEVCEYTINSDDFKYWRSCTESEIINALKILASKNLAWEEQKNMFRKLVAGEQLKFDNPKPTGYCGGNVRRTPPMYPSSTRTVKVITRYVNKNWEQKEPMTCMSNERKTLIENQCHKLKHAFDTRSYDVVSYPQNGYDYPRRNSIYGNGYNALNHLMNGESWGCYDEYMD